jgi:YidC/Oxa1 family membrane protein insertase
MFSSTLGRIGHPFYVAFAWILAGSFALVPNYAIAIALLTLVVMIVVLPITIHGTRGMMKMQVLAPEVKKIRANYKVEPKMTAAKRRELQERQQAELMALYKENNISPAGGCLPTILQIPIFIILYGTIRGLVHQVIVKGSAVSDPLYVGHGTRIFKAVGAAHGHLVAFGLNLADSVRTPGLAWGPRVPFIALILVALALQYFQMKQANDRNLAGVAANHQMRRIQNLLPLILVVIYVSLPAGVIVYFIVSSLFRIALQAVMYRHDPHIRTSLKRLQAQIEPG